MRVIVSVLIVLLAFACNGSGDGLRTATPAASPSATAQATATATATAVATATAAPTSTPAAAQTPLGPQQPVALEHKIALAAQPPIGVLADVTATIINRLNLAQSALINGQSLEGLLG